MLDRADAVLLAIPLLAASGYALRTAVAVTGIASGLLWVPLTPLGPVAAATVVAGELTARARGTTRSTET